MLVEEDVARVGAVAVDDGGDLAGAAGPAGGSLADSGPGCALEGDGVVGHEVLLGHGGAALRGRVVRRGATTRSALRHHHVDHGCALVSASLAGATPPPYARGPAPAKRAAAPVERAAASAERAGERAAAPAGPAP